jgi:hypothetical protein
MQLNLGKLETLGDVIILLRDTINRLNEYLRKQISMETSWAGGTLTVGQTATLALKNESVRVGDLVLAVAADIRLAATALVPVAGVIEVELTARDAGEFLETPVKVRVWQ